MSPSGIFTTHPHNINKEHSMATKADTTVQDETVTELTNKQIINDGIDRFLAATDVGVQHARYKVMRAIAFQAFVNSIEDGSFDDLVNEAISNVGFLPTGWELERGVKAEAKPAKATAKKATAKPAAKKAPAKATAKAKPAARKRPTR